MDLRHDWKALNDVLFQGQPSNTEAGSLVILEDEGRAIDGVISNGRAFEDRGVDGVLTSKETLDALAAKAATEQAIVLSKKTLDQLVIEAASLGTNYFQQLQSLRAGVMGQVGKRRSGTSGGSNGSLVSIVSRRSHFLLDFLSSGVRRLLPRRFNALVFIDQRPVDVARSSGAFSYRALLLSYSRGQLDQFFEPDFSSLHEERLQNWHNESQAVGQYLESRYILPCYGIFMHQDEWQRCLSAVSQGRKPWRLFVRAHDNGAAVIYPNGFFMKFLLATQRVLVYFGRV